MFEQPIWCVALTNGIAARAELDQLCTTRATTLLFTSLLKKAMKMS